MCVRFLRGVAGAPVTGTGQFARPAWRSCRPTCSAQQAQIEARAVLQEKVNALAMRWASWTPIHPSECAGRAPDEGGQLIPSEFDFHRDRRRRPRGRAFSCFLAPPRP